MIDFKVPRAKDCIIIDTKNWLQNSSQILTVHKMSGRDIPTFISKVIDVSAEKDVLRNYINKNDTVLLTRVASEVAQGRAFETEVGDKRFYNVPIMQVLGVFKEGVISYDTLNMLFDKILIKKIDTTRVGFLDIPNSNTMIGEVVKTGTCKFDKDWNKQELTVKAGDLVLIRDNVTTEIMLGNEIYYATEESMVVGLFNDNKDFSLQNLKLINESIILEQYIPDTTFNTKFLTPSLNFEDEDITDLYNRDLFKVTAVDGSLTKLKKDDIILTDRSVTTYVYIGIDKYFMLSGMNYLEAKVG